MAVDVQYTYWLRRPVRKPTGSLVKRSLKLCINEDYCRPISNGESMFKSLFKKWCFNSPSQCYNWRTLLMFSRGGTWCRVSCPDYPGHGPPPAPPPGSWIVNNTAVIIIISSPGDPPTSSTSINVKCNWKWRHVIQDCIYYLLLHLVLIEINIASQKMASMMCGFM